MVVAWLSSPILFSINFVFFSFLSPLANFLPLLLISMSTYYFFCSLNLLSSASSKITFLLFQVMLFLPYVITLHTKVLTKFSLVPMLMYSFNYTFLCFHWLAWLSLSFDWWSIYFQCLSHYTDKQIILTCSNIVLLFCLPPCVLCLFSA